MQVWDVFCGDVCFRYGVDVAGFFCGAFFRSFLVLLKCSLGVDQFFCAWLTAQHFAGYFEDTGLSYVIVRLATQLLVGDSFSSSCCIFVIPPGLVVQGLDGGGWYTLHFHDVFVGVHVYIVDYTICDPQVSKDVD